MAEIRIEEAAIPPSMAEDHDGVFARVVGIRNATEVAGYGIPDVATPAAELLPDFLDQHEPKRMLIATVEGRIAGFAVHEAVVDENTMAWLDLRVLPEFQGGGIGSALANRIEALARELGNDHVISYAVSSEGAGERLVPPTGAGSLPRRNREVRFLLARGWSLEQVERGSRFVLPGDPAALAELRANAETHATEYDVVTWPGATPPERLDDMAVLHTRMSTDAPSAGLGEPEEIWTAERVVAKEATILAAPLQLLTAAVRHLPSGRLVGYTRLNVPHDPARPVNQWATIVLHEHRGHRLGMLLKVANLQFLSEHAPGHPSVLTWNAEDNRHMLEVNEAVGFSPIGYEGAWRKDLR